VDVLVARSDEEIGFAAERLAAADALGCDTETSALSARHGKIFSVQFSDGELNVLVPLSEGVGLGRLADLFQNERIVKIFHNAKFDLDFLWESGVGVTNVFDTMIAEKVLTRGAGQSSSLAETLYRYFAVDLEKSHRLKFNRKWDGIWTEELVEYALADVVHLPALMREQNAWMHRLGLVTDFEEQMRKVAGPAIYQR
jgi:ribonuclease D